jgi:hypothetical protein
VAKAALLAKSNDVAHYANFRDRAKYIAHAVSKTTLIKPQCTNIVENTYFEIVRCDSRISNITDIGWNLPTSNTACGRHDRVVGLQREVAPLTHPGGTNPGSLAPVRSGRTRIPMWPIVISAPHDPGFRSDVRDGFGRDCSPGRTPGKRIAFFYSLARNR